MQPVPQSDPYLGKSLTNRAIWGCPEPHHAHRDKESPGPVLPTRRTNQNPRSTGRAPRLLCGFGNSLARPRRVAAVEWRREPLWAAARGGRVEWRDTPAWPPWREGACAPGPSSCSYCDHFPCARRFSSRGSSAMATFRKSCGPADSVAVTGRLPTSCRVPAAACLPARPALPLDSCCRP